MQGKSILFEALDIKYKIPDWISVFIAPKLPFISSDTASHEILTSNKSETSSRVMLPKPII